MDHLILTRFFCFNLNLDIFDETLLSNGLYFLKKYLIPSLENQTNKNFTHILLINDNHIKSNSLTIRQLYDLKPNYKFKVLTISEFKEFRQSIKSSDVIISRIDNDAVYNNAVEDTQQHFDETQNLKFYGYRNGITVEDQNFEKCYFTNILYRGGGTNSQFQSIMFNDFPNYNGTIFYDHSNVYKFFRENKIKVNDKSFEINETIQYAYLWTIHDQSVHIVVGQKRHQSNITVELSCEEMRNLFGIIK